MNAQDRKYRFLELMSAVSMLPSIEGSDMEQVTDWVFPNGTLGFLEEELDQAIIAQALQSEEEIQFALVATITNTAIKSVMNRTQNGELDGVDCSEEVEALGVALAILWATHRIVPLMGLMGTIGTLCAQYGLMPPSSMANWIHNPDSASHYKTKDPIKLALGEPQE